MGRLESGTLVATTRASITRLLVERAQTQPGISLHTGHQLERIDLDSRQLHFATDDGPLSIDASDSLVIACDGVWSRARQSLVEQLDDFAPVVDDWGVKFRVLFSEPGARTQGLDPAWHHIFTSRGIYTATLPNGVWCVAVTAHEGDPDEDLLLSKDPCDANVAALRDHLARHAPLTVGLLTRDDLRDFFAREPFGGAVVRCPHVQVDEWLVLLGDAAHSVIPPTGEGVNSGLEDAVILAEQLSSDSPTPLADYEARRMPDLQALGEYAEHLRAGLADRSPAHSATTVGLRIASTALGALGHRDGQVEQRLFGPDAGAQPYREAIGPWIEFRDRWTPPIERFASKVSALVPDSHRPNHRPGWLELPHQSGHGRRLTIVGASTGTGAELAQRAVDLGYEVTCLSRRGTAPAGARSVSGDATDPEVARRAVEGADAVIVTVGGNRGAGRARTAITGTIIDAMNQAAVRRLLVQTSLGTHGSARQLPPVLRQVTPVMLKAPLADHEAQEEAVEASGLDWTIVRPAGLTDGPWTGEVVALGDDDPGRLRGRIARADVAAYLLHCLDDDATIHAAMGISGA